MKISLRLLQLIELFICFIQCEVIVSALHISALEKRYLNSLYYINRYMGMIFRNEYVISIVLFYIKDLLLIGNIESSPCFEILHQDNDLVTCVTCTLLSKITEPRFLVTVVTVVQSFSIQLLRKHQTIRYNHHSEELTCYR